MRRLVPLLAFWTAPTVPGPIPASPQENVQAGQEQSAANVPAPQEQSGAEALRSRVERLRSEGSLTIAGEEVVASESLLELYEERGFNPLWSHGHLRGQLVRAVRESTADGLDPAAYHLAALEDSPADGSPWARLAERDLLFTDALVRLAHHLRFGKVEADGRGAERELSLELARAAEPRDLGALLDSGDVYAGLRGLRPRGFVYRGLVEALARLGSIREAGGWDTLAVGATLRPDSTDPRVPVLRRRLVVEGDLAAEREGGGDVYDAPLQEAVRSFQHRHGLNEDGVVGASTLAELAVPTEARIAQVRVNLERARWAGDLPATFVVVNVAGARVYLVLHGEVAFEARAVVGATRTRTPLFRSALRFLELNPTWTVPPGIVGEVLAQVRRDPAYLRRQGMRVLDGSGRVLDPGTIDFASYSARSFPFVFRQDAGPLNALGRIKFVLPNPHDVYLHDTPSRGLFEREQRTLSHGCVRVQNPTLLAELLLDDPVRWSRKDIEAAIAEGTTRSLALERPVPVLILYWTAAADLHGDLHFYRDVYGRDAALLRALDGA